MGFFDLSDKLGIGGGQKGSAAEQTLSGTVQTGRC